MKINLHSTPFSIHFGCNSCNRRRGTKACLPPCPIHTYSPSQPSRSQVSTAAGSSQFDRCTVLLGRLKTGVQNLLRIQSPRRPLRIQCTAIDDGRKIATQADLLCRLLVCVIFANTVPCCMVLHVEFACIDLKSVFDGLEGNLGAMVR